MKFLPALALLALSSPAVAGSSCGDRDDILARLADRYDEAPTAIGLSTDGGVLELLTSPAGTWSVLITTPSGRTCMVASGIAFERLPVQVGEAGA